MKDVVEALEGIIEFLIQGSLMVVVIMYFAAFAHPIPTLLRKYLADLWKAISGRDTPKGSANPLMIALACAALYFLGIMSNVVNYWVLRPVHNSIIQEARQEGSREVRQEGCEKDFVPRRGDFEFLSQSFARLLTREDPSRTAYDEYLSDDAKWRDQNLEAHESIFPALRKYIRIVRGVAVAGYAVFFIALLKSLVGLLIVVACAPWKGTPNRFARGLFRYLVSYAAYQNRRTKVKVVHDTLKRMVVPNLILAAFGLIVFSVAIWSYRTIEYELQLLVMFGASKGSPAWPGLLRLLF
jgi:hypothetical protein